MKLSPIILATLAMASASPISQQVQTEQAMTGVEGSVTNARQVMDTLTRRLQQAGGDPNEHADRMGAFITGADSQIDNAIATVSDALAPFTLGVSKAIGNFLLGPFVQSVTNGAEVLLSNLIGGSEDRIDAELTARLTGDYSKLIALSKENNVDVSKLQDLNQQISNTLPRNSKRATDANLSGVEGSVTNARQVQDTLTHRLQQAGGDPHANADRLVAFITGADSQIDNAIATVSDALAPFTLGVSKAIGNFLLGPFVQSVTNGAEVLLANLIGGGADMVDAQMTAQLTGNYSKLIALSKNNNVDVSKLQNLNQQITNTVSGKN